jgi:hypothetical protein
MTVLKAALGALVLATAAGLGVGACVVDVSLDGTTCPCAEGYMCDPRDDTCIEEECRVSARLLESQWETPHTIMFAWTPLGAGDEVVQVELVVAESEEDVETRTGSARVVSDSENPDLSSFETSEVVLSLVSGLSPDTIYYAQLVSLDSDQCQSRSNVIAIRTAKLSVDDPIELFGPSRRDSPPGLPVPGTRLVDGGGADYYAEYIPKDNPECVGEGLKAECGQPFKLNFPEAITVATEEAGLNLVHEETFGGAYLEIVVTYESTIPARWALVWLMREGDVVEGQEYELGGWAIPNGPEPRTFEIPLRMLASEAEGPLDFDQLLASPFNQFALGAQWLEDASVRIHAVRIYHAAL